MPAPRNYQGERFGNIFVIKEIEPTDNVRQWLVSCDCGKKFVKSHKHVATAKSCGCARKEKVGNINRKHSKVKHELYSTWKGMRQRCSNKNSMFYKNYGGRGIEVCSRWNNFENFLNDMGERPKGKTIDRINNNGNYEPNNCRWASRSTQASNTRQSINITFKGVTKSASDWSRSIGGSHLLVSRRLKKGWTIEEALTTPPQNNNAGKK